MRTVLCVTVCRQVSTLEQQRSEGQSRTDVGRGKSFKELLFLRGQLCCVASSFSVAFLKQSPRLFVSRSGFLKPGFRSNAIACVELLALRKRKPQEMQALALASS